MATVRFSQRADMLNPYVYYGSIRAATPTQIEINDGWGNYGIYRGSFQYSSTDLVGGTVSSYSNYKNFSLEYSATSTNPVPALVVYSYLQNGDAVGLQTYILSGADQITGSNSNDVLAGRDGNDRIDGGLGNDTIYGQTGNDVILFSSGTDYVFGDSGADTLEVSSFAARFSVGRSDQNYFFVRELSSSNTTFLNGIERVKFLDFSVGLDNQVGGTSGFAYRLYKAALDRTPDLSGLGDWVQALDAGMAREQVASGFINSAEFRGKYSSGLSNSAFVELLYNNVLDRASDPVGKAGWVGALDSRALTKEQVLIGFSESAENFNNTISLIGNGVFFVE